MNYLEVLSTIKHEGINRYKNAFNADSIEDLVQQGELLACLLYTSDAADE